jgi:CBS domain-containing protein
MDVKEIMHKGVEKADPSTTISDAVTRMMEKDISYLIVVKNSKLAGIVTEDDIIKKVVGKGKHPQQTTLEEIMVREVVHIKPDTSLEDAAEIMTKNEIKKLPVVDGNNLLGIVTATDMIAAEPKMMEHLGELILLARKQKRIAG